jgi:hypothetical protein
VAIAARDMVGIHATDPASVYLGAFARVDGLTFDGMAAALYDDRTVLKILGMRRTMFVVPRDVASVMNAAVTRAIGVRERNRLLQVLRDAKVADDVEAWVDEVEAQTVATLDEMGEATATQLTGRVPGLRVQIPFGEGKKWGGKFGVSTRMLFLLAAEGRIIRGRPRGTWLSSMYAWVPMDRWVPGGLAELPTDEAQAELISRWLRAFGPGTQRDIQWWTGLTVRETRQALTAVGAVEVQLDDGFGFALPDDLAGTPDPGPWVALLPALDTTTMGWKERDWYLDGYGKALFDTSGNAGPTVWVDGHVVGGWAIRPDGSIVHRLLESVGREAEQATDAAVHRLEAWLGKSRIIPRFRTPLELELT